MQWLLSFLSFSGFSSLFSNNSRACSSSDSQGRSFLASCKVARSSIRSTFMMTLAMLTMICFAGAVLPGCASKDRIAIARAAKLPDEANGFLQVATDDPVLVHLVGSEDVAAERSIAGYIVLHESDLQKLIQNTAALQKAKARVAQLEHFLRDDARIAEEKAQSSTSPPK